MSFGGSDDRDGKRKHQWTGYNSGAKRFHGSVNNPREEFHRGVGSRWDREPKTFDQGSFSKPYRSPLSSWGIRGRTSYNRFPHPTSHNNGDQIFEFQHPVSSGPPKESEELIGPGSDVERMEKVQAAKKRVEEALASKTSNSNNKEINFQNSSASSLGKNKDKESHGPNLDLSLTNSDFKEIGSVASAVPIEGDIESTDFTNNTSSNIAIHISQQRSFDNATSNLPASVQATQQKPQKVGGWSMSAVNNIVSEPNKPYPSRPRNDSNESFPSKPRNDPNESFPSRQRNDMYFQEQREEILGSVSTATIENTVDHYSSKQLNDSQINRHEFSRIGHLYQSFLKSRLYGYTLKLRDKSARLTGPNPLLDKTVLENRNSVEPITEEQVLELQKPQPLKVKMKNMNELNTGLVPEHIAIEEANAKQFCLEYSYLLKDPNFLIPPDDLEKLGLGYLTEMNKLISDKRCSGTSESPLENQDFLISSSCALNSAAGNIAVDVNKDASTFSTSHNTVQKEIIDKFKERDPFLNNGTSYLHHGSVSPSGSQNPSSLNHTMRPDILRSPLASPFQNVSVETVVEKVVKTMLQPSNINSVLNSSITSTSETRANFSKSNNEGHTSVEQGTSFTKKTQSDQMQDVSSKILRLFLIDKQVEELMAEKMKIYSELLSSQGVSQTLFHSWAHEQIQLGNVMSVVSNTSNVIPELSRVINPSIQEITPLQNPNTQFCPNNTLDETISELYSLKQEYGNPEFPMPVKGETGSCEPSILPADSCFLAPQNVIQNVVLEENRPKLSVRKDLLDPNRSSVNLLNTQIKTSATVDSVNQNDGKNTANSDGTNMKRKKKKSKKKDSVEIINLIEDTDDEISSGTGVDSVATDDLSIRGLNSEDEVDKKDNTLGSAKISYELDGKTVTCMTIMKVKKAPTRVLVVGCKDGYVMGYALGNPAVNFTKKIHNDTVIGVYHLHKYLITGSTDTTVCLFSLKEQVETQTLSVNAPVQSMDINFQQLIVGTKAGSIYTYFIKAIGDKKKMFVSLHPNKKSLCVTNSSILAVKLAKEGVRKVLIVASRGEQITVRDATSGLLLRTFDWCDTVYCLQLYEETPLVYCGTNTKSVKVVNYTDGENTDDCLIGRGITQIVFLQSVMFAASYDGHIYIYDVQKKSLMATVIISKGIIQCLAINSKNSVILVASNRGDLQQIPFPASLMKHLRKLNISKKKSQNQMQPQET